MLRTKRFGALVLAASLVAALSCSGASASRDSPGGGDDSPARSRKLVARAGTVIELRARQTVSSRYNRPGNLVSATAVSSTLGPGGEVVIPDGAVFYGSIAEIAPAERPGERGVLHLAITQVRLEGHSYPVQARVTSMATQLHGRGVTTGDAAKVGAGAVVGGIAGRIVGGNKTGTLVGAAAGAAGGAVYANRTRDIDVVLPRGGTIRLLLTAPFSREIASTP